MIRMWWWAVAAAWLTMVGFAWAICKAGGDEDDRLERALEDAWGEHCPACLDDGCPECDN